MTRGHGFFFPDTKSCEIASALLHLLCKSSLSIWGWYRTTFTSHIYICMYIRTNILTSNSIGWGCQLSSKWEDQPGAGSINPVPNLLKPLTSYTEQREQILLQVATVCLHFLDDPLLLGRVSLTAQHPLTNKFSLCEPYYTHSSEQPIFMFWK